MKQRKQSLRIDLIRNQTNQIYIKRKSYHNMLEIIVVYNKGSTPTRLNVYRNWQLVQNSFLIELAHLCM